MLFKTCLLGFLVLREVRESDRQNTLWQETTGSPNIWYTLKLVQEKGKKEAEGWPLTQNTLGSTPVPPSVAAWETHGI